MAGKLTSEARIKLSRQAVQLRETQNLTQREIAAKLDVSQPTVATWLRRYAAGGWTLQERTAHKIRAELVCCDIYQRMEDAYNPEDDTAWKALRHSRNYHDICFFGEWAARLAEQVK